MVGATTYAHSKSGVTPALSRGPIKLAIGLQVESIDVDIMFDASTFILGTTPGAFANAGGFDGARIKIDKLLTPDLNDTSRGVVNLFNGTITECDVTSTKVTIHVASDLVYLNAVFPHRQFQPPCNNALFDSRCGLNKASFAVNGTCTAGNTNTDIMASALTQATGYFALGYVVITSGVNNGLIRAVKASVSGDLTLAYPLPTPCATGDTFTAYPGCDKLQATCSGKFSNLARFGGFPYLPDPNTLAMGQSGTAPIDNSGAGAGPGDIPRGRGGRKDNFDLV
ncbi:MAG: phage BR0599 family protein [Proteobacteria bacterium]|nr:phage BR0599 family protein [Pseudomonadota bacterium]